MRMLNTLREGRMLLGKSKETCNEVLRKDSKARSLNGKVVPNNAAWLGATRKLKLTLMNIELAMEQ